ncbi:hypothetical protein ACLOJK_008154 [Asimina triloba]
MSIQFLKRKAVRREVGYLCSPLLRSSPATDPNPFPQILPLSQHRLAKDRSPSPPPNAVYPFAAKLAKNPIIAYKPSKILPSPSSTTLALRKWVMDNWKSKKALRLPKCPNKEELDVVLKTLEAFSTIVFAGETCHLEDHLANVTMGKAFLLQGGDCTESFKEFNANNIRDTFRILLQMGFVIMFGEQMPIVKGGRMAGQFAKLRSDPLEEENGVKLSRPSPQEATLPYKGSPSGISISQSTMNREIGNALNLIISKPLSKPVLCFVANNRYKELAHQVDEALGFMAVAGLIEDHLITNTTEFWTSHEESASASRAHPTATNFREDAAVDSTASHTVDGATMDAEDVDAASHAVDGAMMQSASCCYYSNS